MTSSSYHLPGDGFSVWIQQPPAIQAVQLVSSTTHANPKASDSGAGSESGSAFDTYPEATQSRRGGFFKWAALFLFLCALAAFLSSESKRKEVVEERDGLQVAKETLTKEKQMLHDNLVEEQATTAMLTEEIGGLENSLEQSKANVVQLTAEKNGLSRTIDDLRGSLAMAIEDHKNTEASLQRVIKGLETKNAELTSTLQQERSRLEELDNRLSEVMKDLSQAQTENQNLADENASLRDKVAQLQSSLEQTVKDAEARENDLRDQLDALKQTNQALAASLDTQQQELSEVKEKLKASEEALASDKDADNDTQSQLNDLASKLEEAIVARDRLDQEKQAMATSVAELTKKLEDGGPDSASTLALQERLAALEAKDDKSAEQIKALESAREELLQRNAQLQRSVEELNGHLSKLAEKDAAEENSLTQRIDELTKTNEELKKSLESQRNEFNILLREANRATSVSEPSAATENEALEGAVQDLKNTLDKSIGREAETKRELSSVLTAHTEEMLQLNTRAAQATSELEAAKELLHELDKLRSEVRSLRAQGEQLEDELGQRATHISTLSEDNASWQKETEKLRSLLETEQLAQSKLQVFVDSLQSRIDAMEMPAPEVANK